MSEPSALTEAAEQLFRQVHPTQAPDGSPTSEAFVPSKTDQDLLSTSREVIGPQEAFRRWTEDRGYRSVGTYAVTVGEAAAEELSALDDAETHGPDHASIDFRDVPSKGKKKQKGRKLRDAAVARGCLYTP